MGSVGRRPAPVVACESSAGRVATAIRRCELLVPPPSSHGHQELDRVLIALCLCANIAELRLLILPLRIEQTDNARTAAAIVDLLQAHGLRGHGQRVRLSSQEIRIMLQRLQDVRDLPKSLQYRLLIVSRGFFEGSQRSATFCLPHATVEDRLSKSRRDAPYESARTEQLASIQRISADTGRKRYGRIELRRSDSDLCTRGMELRLSCLNIRPLMDKLRRDADRQAMRQCEGCQIKIRR